MGAHPNGMCCARFCLEVNAGELVTLLHSRHRSDADVWGSYITAPRILNLGTRYR